MISFSRNNIFAVSEWLKGTQLKWNWLLLMYDSYFMFYLHKIYRKMRHYLIRRRIAPTPRKFTPSALGALIVDLFIHFIIPKFTSVCVCLCLCVFSSFFASNRMLGRVAQRSYPTHTLFQFTCLFCLKSMVSNGFNLNHWWPCVYYVVGRGFRINFPVSSQDILKSLRTCRVLDVNICGAITILCMPITNRNTALRKTRERLHWKFAFVLRFGTEHLRKVNAAKTKTKWFISDSGNGTTAVFGSVSQYQAPTDVIIDMVASKTKI